MVKDPVCGTEVKESKSKAAYKGKTYYFCCPTCQWAFEKKPKKFT